VPLSRFGRAALAYVKRLDLYVLPLWGVSDGVCLCPKKRACGRDTGKHPIRDLVPHGKNEASNNPGVVCGWWERVPDANIGVACGLSGLLTVDIDPRNGGRETWEALIEVHGIAPDTWEAETGGGGLRKIFRRLDIVPAKDRKLGAGIDIKADGYIVVAPSVHKSELEYTWLSEADPFNGAPLADPPAWLVEKLRAKDDASPVITPIHGFRYLPGVKPPPEFWDALPTDISLAGIWHRTRRPPNQLDDTPSAWMMSLRLRLLKYRLSPQEALNTMVAYRRKHGDTHRGRKWFLNEAAQYAVDLENPATPSPVDAPPPGLRRNPRRVNLAKDAVEQAVRHGEKFPLRTAVERLLLIHLTTYAKNDEFASPSQERLAKTTGLSLDYVSRRLRHLEQWGCIEKVRRSGPKTTNKYWLRFLDIPHEHTT